ncbi:SusD/RagB-like outer membrane lipoprotein [Aquimarina intermedia]|uniref:SusD/RagB-like outer membrane lipoprotein n=1 Tax=Aquimarina intermedia TaxID=350814 RepID=A0A5S5CBW0_9FLAO|nr:SusD/RagB-like outer membrane lipoprotein [Aquimarina intermedia]
MGLGHSFSEKGVMQNFNDIKKLTEDRFPTTYSVAQILRVETMHRVTDVYGPTVYSRYGDLSVSNPVFDSQEQVYNLFFEELDAAIIQLVSDKNNDQLANFDFAYSGNVSNWIRFANTLRLRLAMRIANVNPQKAKLEGEKSINHPEGLLISNSQNFIVNGGATHPLTVFNSSWNDTRMNASMESFLVGYNDPRGDILFQNSEVTPGKLKGIRSGMPLLNQYSDEISQKEDYTPFSKLGKMFDADENPTTSITLMTAAEAYFLQAEAALRGWSGAGDAQSNYETGIQISFEQANAPNSNEYILNDTSTPSDYIDPVNPNHNITKQTSLTVAWDAGDDQETKLEKIITQK